MSEALNNLKDEYKQMKKDANSREEKQQIKQDYKEMKTLIKGADKLLKETEEEQKKWNKVWDKLDKEYQKFGETPTFEKDKKNDYFKYKKGDIKFEDFQCSFCKYNDLYDKTACIKYPNGKPNNIINSETKCEYLEIEENNNMDNNETFEKGRS